MSTEHLSRLLGRYLGFPPDPVRNIDWQSVMALAEKNRVLPLVQDVINPSDDVPVSIQRRLRDEARKSFAATVLVADNLSDIAGALDGIHWMLLRGPVLGHMVYKDPLHRPFGDLDVLVAQEDRAEAARRLNQIGFILPEKAMSIRYYETVHLHYPLERPGLAGPTRLELHWDIDHPFTLYTIDVEGILQRRVYLTIRGSRIPVPDSHDLIIMLAIHAAKHAAPLPYWIRERKTNAIVRTGHLLHFMDLALLLNQNAGLVDPDVISARCQSWGTVDALGNCLAAIGLLWPGLGLHPFQITSQPVHPVKLWLFHRIGSRGFGQLPLLFFRPIRLLDIISYLLPPAEYLRRKTGKADVLTRVGHTSRGIVRLMQGGLLVLAARLRHVFGLGS